MTETVVAGVKALIDGWGVEKVASLVEDGAAKVFQSAADFLLSFFGLDAIPKTIRGVVSKLANAVPNKVKELLGKLKKVIIDKLEKLWGGLGFWGKTEWTAGGEKHKVWVDFKRGKVRVASKEQDASEHLKDLKRQADESKNEKAQKSVAEAQDVLERTQESIGALQTAAQKSEQTGQKGAKKQGADAKAVQSESTKAQAGLKKLAELLKESQEALGAGTCKIGGQQKGKQAGCWREGTKSRRGVGETRTIEQWRRGHRIATLSIEEREGTAPPRLVIDPALWREVFLIQDDADNGGVLTMELLRPLEWLEPHGVKEGTWVPIDLREMGVQGEALVTAVQPCPEIEEGEGRLVTGTFRRSKALVLELKVSGESEVLGVTGNHMVWSEDRQDWVRVKDLRIGERMRAWDGGTPAVESLTACREPEPVYNLEVEGDHCYRVGEQGLLVHNASIFMQIQIKENGDGFGYAKQGQRARTVLSVGRNNRQALLKGWYTFGSLTYRTQCDPKTGELVKGGKEETIPIQISGVGLIRNDNREGHVEKKLIDLLENAVSTSASSGCVCIVQVFTERSPCKGDDSCASLLRVCS